MHPSEESDNHSLHEQDSGETHNRYRDIPEVNI